MRIAFIGQKGIGIGETGGGVETHVTALATRLAARGHEVTVYARRRYGVPRALPKGARVRFVPTAYRKNLEAIVAASFATLDALVRRYDIVHYHGVGPALLCWVPRLLRPDMRVVVTFHAQDRFHEKWGTLARAALWLGEWAACLFPHATIVVSHVLQLQVRGRMRRQAVYVPNGVDVERSKDDARVRRLGLTPGKYVLCVSRLVPHKGQDLLIGAFLALKRRGEAEGWKLAIVGAPSYTEDYLDGLREKADGDPAVRFLGFRSGEDLRELYSHAYLLVQPSRSEGLSVTVLEAMGYGLPVLASDIPENVEAIAGAGFTFRNGDAPDLAERLGELLRHPPLVAQAAHEARRAARDEFSWDAVADKTEAVYRSLRH